MAERYSVVLTVPLFNSTIKHKENKMNKVNNNRSAEIMNYIANHPDLVVMCAIDEEILDVAEKYGIAEAVQCMTA